jgi:histidinol dehydrogenase
VSDLIRIVDARLEDPFQVIEHRGVARDAQTERIVAEIISDVRMRGDEALLEAGRKFDSPYLQTVAVTDEEVERAVVPPHALDAIRESIRRVKLFHERQLGAITAGFVSTGQGYAWAFRDDAPDHSGWFGAGALGQRLNPVRRAGIYVPGGGAPYASSVIMNAAPAIVAGVEQVVLTSPASGDGGIAPGVLCAACELGIEKVFKVGGASAIAALALGTESIPRVDTVAGPGNRFVNEAKRQLWGTVGVDGYAGPSEVCVLADDTANPAWAAADLLTQIEHAPDNAAFLVVTCREMLNEILAHLEQQLRGAARESTMRTALHNESLAILAVDLDQACEFVNAIAPEHITVSVADPEKWIGKIRNAGCILMGDFTPESAGDFCLGPSHTLPTSGAARFASPVNVLNFMKLQSVAHMTCAQLQPLIPVIEAFGEMEGFPAHARGATIRND